MLGKLLVTPVNLLLLDEPTNHLDMDACDALLAAIDNFDGTVIMVTHNEMFLHALAEKLIVFKNDRQEVFNGGYQQFLEKGGWEDETATTDSDPSGDPEEVPGARLTKKELRKMRSRINAEKGKALKPVNIRMKAVEGKLEHLEKMIDRCNKELVSASQNNEGGRIADLSKELKTALASADDLYDELETLTDSSDQIRESFENQLAMIEKD